MSAQPQITESPLTEVVRAATSETAAPKPRKKLIRRTDTDRSQHIRRIVQLAFVGLNIYLGEQFYLWVRFFETSGASRYVTRPAGVEGWLPIAALMNLKYLVLTGTVPQ